MKKYCPGALKDPHALSVDEIYEKLGIQCRYAMLPREILGVTYFSPHWATVCDGRGRNPSHEMVRENEVLLNYRLSESWMYNRRVETMIHEAVHIVMHGGYFRMRRLLGREEETAACCEADQGYQVKCRRTPEEWVEWQAASIAPRIRMNKDLVREEVRQYYPQHGMDKAHR